MAYRMIKLIAIMLFAMSACARSNQSPTPSNTYTPSVEPIESNQTAEPETLTVMTHDSFAVSDEVITKFENANNVKVQFLASGDTGTALNKAILAKNNPLADVFYGVDNTFLSRALEEDIFVPYPSPNLIDIPDNFEVDPEHRVLPVDFGDVCPNYDISFFDEKKLEPPNNLEDLSAPEYSGMLVVENPATSSPGLAFLLSTIAQFGEDGYLEYWNDLVDNDVLVVNDWDTAYYTEFTRSGGTRPIVISYGSSPPFEVLYAAEPMEEPPTKAIVSEESCFRQIEFVGILNGTEKKEIAEKWVDFMLSPTFQEDVPLQMFVFPVNEKAQLDDIFVKYLSVPEDPAYLDPDLIAKNREKWIKDWTETVLR